MSLSSFLLPSEEAQLVQVKCERAAELLAVKLPQQARPQRELLVKQMQQQIGKTWDTKQSSNHINLG